MVVPARFAARGVLVPQPGWPSSCVLATNEPWLATPFAMLTEGAHADDRDLWAVLETAQGRGFIGDGDLTPHIEHTLGFVRAIGTPAPRQCLDLGSGGGLPGLVLARYWPESRWVLLDASEQRTAFLTEAVESLALGDRVEVVRGRAEELAHDQRWRAQCDLVVARAFGPPGVVAECGAGFLEVGGRLVVSEPPVPSADRWSHPDALASLGLVRAPAVLPSADGRGRFEVLVCETLCIDRYPRRVGIPAKRPLF